MSHRAEVLLLYTDELDTELGPFETATEARAACARHEGGVLAWSQLEDGIWETQGVERWYRVSSE